MTPTSRAAALLALASLTAAAALGTVAAQDRVGPVADCELRPASAPPVRSERGVEFARPRGTVLRLDLDRPDDAAIRPAVVLIHGGGWGAGRRDLTTSSREAFAAHGYVAASVDYRLARSGRSTFP